MARTQQTTAFTIIYLCCLCLILSACMMSSNQVITDKPSITIENTGHVAAGKQDSQNKVAILLPLTGTHAAMGQSMLNAAQMALFDMGGDTISLIPRDTKGTAQGAREAITAAIRDGANIILGPLLGSSLAAIKPIAQSNNINIISFSTDQSLANSSTFVIGLSPIAQTEQIVKYAVSQRLKNFAIIAPNDNYGDLVTQSFHSTLRQYAIEPIEILRFSSNETAIINDIAQLHGKNIDAVFMPVGGTLVETISSTLSYHGLTPNKVTRIGTGLWDDPRIAKQPNIQGGIFAAPSPMARTAFNKTYQETYKQPPVRLATLAYDATALIAVLSKKNSLTTASLLNANGYTGMDGLFRLNSDGTINRQLAILSIQNNQITEQQAAALRF